LFSYYGSKSKLVSFYPPPRYDTIIEPFAGSAAYALSGDNWQKNVILYDTNPKVAAVWDYLIHATEADIAALPDVRPGQKVTDFNLTEAERWLVGFNINRGSSMPKITASRRSNGLTYKKYISENLYKVKHWKIFGTSYELCPNQEATWFVDPPYQKAGKYYFGFTQMNFEFLRGWCQERRGQVIVCENQGADWLPFRPMTIFWGSTKSQVEMIYTQDSAVLPLPETEYDFPPVPNPMPLDPA
jgi:site-specific DNA-adenine methylase